MPQIGSFALLLALGLAAYSFLVGAFALILDGPGSPSAWGRPPAVPASPPSGPSIGRAGHRAAFTNDFSVAYIFHHSNKDLPGPYKFAVLWSGQEGFAVVLVSGASDVRLCSSSPLQN
jgi:cytochrome c-type biogenesis protein CcmF